MSDETLIQEVINYCRTNRDNAISLLDTFNWDVNKVKSYWWRTFVLPYDCEY